MIKCLVIGMLIILSISSFAQTSEPFCGTDAIYQNNPLLKQEWINKTLALRNAKVGAVDPNMVFTVPVVFIVYNLGEAIGTGSNVSDATINTTLQYINQAFRAQGSFSSGTDVKIQFQLAKYDNQCNASSGIVRINASGIPNYSNGFASSDVAMQNQLRTLTPTWSENNCIIIRLVNNMTDYGGYSYFWNDMFVESAYANGNISASLLFTHELGHSFSLLHTFEGDNNGANCPPNSDPDNQGDYISDTQPHKINDNCAFQSTADINSCTGIAFGTVLLNHMSYSNSCKDRFTPKQIERMRNGLVAIRPNWVNSQALTGQSNIPTPIASGAAVCGPSTVTLSASGCTGVYNWYASSSGGNSLGTGESFRTPFLNSSKDYYVDCTVGNCVSMRASAPVIIRIIPSAPLLSASPGSISVGGSSTLSATNCSGIVIWSNSLGSGTSKMVSPTTTTTYTATCAANDCMSGSSSVTVTVNSTTPPPVISANPSVICTGQSSILSASNCSGIVTWSNSLGIGTSKMVTPAGTTTYTATCTVSGITSANSNGATVTVYPIPSAPTLSASPSSINSGQSSTLSASNCSGTVTWSNSLGTGTGKTVFPTSTTTYTATCTANGCTSSNESVTVTVNTAVSPPTISIDKNNVCSGESVTLSATNCAGTVTWNQNLGTGTPKTAIPDVSRTYVATCTVSGITSTNSNSVSVTVNPKPDAPTLSVNPSSINSGQSSALSATNCGGTVTWSNSLGTGTSKTVFPTSTTTYTATCTANGCTSSNGSITVTVNPVTNPCPPTITHNTGVLPAGTYQAGQTINSKANISSPTTFKAGQSILFTNGFSAGPNETFLAKIEGCATISANGLVAYYPFNGNANDESGNNYHGAIDGATLATDRKGITNKAFSFNGTNGRIRVEDTPNLNFSSSFSISFWAKINAWGNNNNTAPGIVSKKASDQNVGYVIYNDGFYLNKINFRLKGSSTEDYMPSNTSVTIGSWECWTMVYNSVDGTNKLFRNGVLDKSYSTGNLGNMSSTAPLYFGYSQTWNGYLNGLLDEIRIYNRAITNDEVLQIYNAEKP